MNIRCISLPSQYPLLHSPQIKLISLHKFPKSSTLILRASSPTIPPRDRIVDFGKHKGKMLGTLPSNYLKWISKNLITRDFEHWAKLADQVLEDPVYRDRIEWEFADRVLTGGDKIISDRDTASELFELSERFGWDYEDKIGWGKIDFGLLGTSKGGRIPRVCERREGEERELKAKKREKARVLSEGRVRRRERRERMRSKGRVLVSEQPLKERLGSEEESGGDDDDDDEIKEDRTAEIRSRFPGRQSLFEKALSRRRRM